MPNPWDRGSALLLEEMGFPALATTSAGLGRSIGKDDQQVTRSELLQHVSELTNVISVPLSVDSERLFPEEEGGVRRCVELLAEAGAAGCSIEDYDPSAKQVVPFDEAVEAVAEAAEACGRTGLVLTARCENHLYGVLDLSDTIDRLTAYREVGAEVVYAPGLVSSDDIGRVVEEVRAPLNVLALPVAPSVEELRKLGVRRVSTGSLLFNVTRRTLRAAARELLDSGTSLYAL